MTERRDAAARFPHLRWWLAGIAALALLVAYHAWWLVRVRHHYPVDIDEAGYISIALNDLAGLRAHGVGGLWNAFQQQAPQAPLVPLLAVPALAIHKAILPVFAVELATLVVVVLATYGLARRLVGPRWAVLAALTVAATPGIINYAREFSFALPCTAALTVSLWSLLRSDHLTRRSMVLLWGVAGGVAVLARTMAIGYMPGLVVAGILWAALAPAPARRAALLNAFGGAAAGVAVAAVWYWRNLPYVMDYLRGYGYGATASQYGTKHSVLSASWWYDDLDVAARQELFMPLFVMLVLVLVCGAVLAVRALAVRRSDALLVALRSPAAPLVVVVVAGYLSLATTANVGSVFALPLLPTALVLVLALAAQIPVRSLRVVAAAGFVLVAAVQLVSFAQVGGPLDRIRLAGVWPFPEMPIVDPRAPAVGAVGVTPNEMRFGPRDRGWIELAGQVGSLAASKTWSEGRLPILAFASRDRLLNINMVALASLLSPAGGGLPLAQLTADGGDTPAAYRRFLSNPAHGQPNVLAISDGERNDYEPTVTQAHVVIAARSLGFAPFASVRQPNGELVRLWWLRRGAAIPAPPSPG